MPDVFHFKRFDLVNAKSGLKLGTDGVLLGVVTELAPLFPHDLDIPLKILDIGTGTGVVALILAQRLEKTAASITALEIDADAAAEASGNFAASPWRDSLRCIHSSLQKYEAGIGMGVEYDLIVSNPPYYDNTYKNDFGPTQMTASRAVARHTESLSYRDVIAFAAESLAPQGHIALILPAEEEMRLKRYAASFGFRPLRTVYVRTTAAKQPKRIVMELGRAAGGDSSAHGTLPSAETLTIMENGRYSDRYISLTEDFYLNLH